MSKITNDDLTRSGTGCIRVGHGLDSSMDWIGLDWIGSNFLLKNLDWLGLGQKFFVRFISLFFRRRKVFV